MPLTPAFTISQSALTPQNVTATDTSTGSDARVATRRIFFQTPTGTYLTENGSTDYNDWPIANASQTFDVLDQDYALSITVQWLDDSDNVLYTLTQVFCLAEYNKQFFYYLIQQQATTPSILQDNAYASNIISYWMNISGAIQAVTIGADIAASQNCLNRATNMKDNQQMYF
jgi:hypothetical protein